MLYGVHGVDTCLCFASLVSLGSFKNLILSAFVTDWCLIHGHFHLLVACGTTTCSNAA